MYVTSVKTQNLSTRKASLSKSFLIYSSGTQFFVAPFPPFACSHLTIFLSQHLFIVVQLNRNFWKVRKYVEGGGGGAEKIERVQQFFKHHLKFTRIFENILGKSGRP